MQPNRTLLETGALGVSLIVSTLCFRKRKAELIALKYKKVTIRFFGDVDGNINGCYPTLFTNMFDMIEEKDG